MIHGLDTGFLIAAEMGRKREAFDCLSVARYLQNAAGTKNGSAADEASLFDRWESLVGDA